MGPWVGGEQAGPRTTHGCAITELAKAEKTACSSHADQKVLQLRLQTCTVQHLAAGPESPKVVDKRAV